MGIGISRILRSKKIKEESMRKSKFLALALVGVMALGLFVGCGEKKEEKKPEVKTEKKGEKKEPLKEITVAYMPNMGSVSSIVAAQEINAFEKMGLKVELKKFSGGPPEIAALNSGDIDIAQIGHGAHKLCIQGKADIFQMDATSLADAVIGNADKGVKTLADLKGKTIATTAGTSADIILKLALKQAGLTDADVKLQEMEADGVVPAMISGKIDACSTWSPATVTIKEKLGDKAVFLADNSKYLDEAVFPSSFIATSKYAKENRDVLVKFAAAIQLGQDYRIKDIEKVAKGVAKLTESSEDIMLKAKGEGNWATSGSEFFGKGLADGTIKKYYESQQKLFKTAGAIKEDVPVEKYVHFDIMKEANELAKK